jgi:hypothetical protein
MCSPAHERATLSGSLCVDDDARRGLAGLVHPRGVGRADVDPHAHHAREITHGERWLVRLGQAVGERDAFRVFEAVGEDARDEMVLGLRRMPRGADRERLVDAAIDVGQLDLEAVDRRRHASKPLRGPVAEKLGELRATGALGIYDTPNNAPRGAS